MDDLAIRRVEHWVYRFGVMLTLSVIVAVMGLELNSAAVVIGAMLLAPLMQPVLAAGACLSMALFVRSLGALTKVVLATAWCIGLSYLMAKLLPNQELTTEVLARTKPDIRDLVVALAAGTAGAYATVREDVSSSLPGVAVAVALVPPLAAIGITLEAGDRARAEGAMLLYTTNLSAIIFASIVVFVVTGFVPPRRLANTFPRLILTSVLIAGLVIVVAYPLFQASQSIIEANNDLATAEAIVDDWLGESDLERTVRFENGRISVELRGFESPPDQDQLESELAQRFPSLEGAPLVRWIRTERATTTTTAPVAADVALKREVEGQVQAWLDESGIDYQIDTILITDGVVRIDAAGTGDPPSLLDLSDRLSGVAQGLTPRLNWSELETIEPGDQIATPLELVTQSIQVEVETWAATRGLTVRSVLFDGETLEVEVVGAEQPSQQAYAELLRSVEELAGSELELKLFFFERVPVTTTTRPPTTLEFE
jgi:uncharacterized hydrophobic protein (TIGR00271 family)